jgi:hypothetical protein
MKPENKPHHLRLAVGSEHYGKDGHEDSARAIAKRLGIKALY